MIYSSYVIYRNKLIEVNIQLWLYLAVYLPTIYICIYLDF